ncbi:hypothetical protein NUW58_g1900 [Xylaria curta]|uniref:Uncharacterized protein n=1 Tax=Xylaria curta TaxID=42375 RepID=A0ACC1PJ31_9PEZI|nr:hypothetical protein NUW58_g1900 [Xylaria curta]
MCWDWDTFYSIDPMNVENDSYHPSGYRSATEYDFDEGQADAIVWATTYRREDYRFSMIWFPPCEHDSIRSSIATPFRHVSDMGLGSLERLPLELLHIVIFSLDIYTLFKFRQANLRSRQIVDSLTEYQTVASHGLNLLCALLRARLPTDTTLSDIHCALCTKACAFCGEFAGFISLLIWKRCCIKCIRNVSETQVRTLATIRSQFDFTQAQLDQLRSFRTLPRACSTKLRTRVVSGHQAILVSGWQPSAIIVQALRGNWGGSIRFNFMGSCALPYLDRQTGDVEYALSCAGCQLAVEKGIIGSSADEWAFEVRVKVYTKSGFLEHFRWCKQAQLLWRLSDEGKHQSPELLYISHRGDYFVDRE